jgi:glycosyltransferase involved in cell wall biosynthesis
MLFILDGRYIQDHFPGIGRYAFNLAGAVSRVAADDKVRVLYNPRLRNTRYDVASLGESPNVELVRVDAPTFSLHEQFMGANLSVTMNAALWHSPDYLMPYVLPLRSVVTLEDVMPLVLREEMPSAARRLVYRLLNLFAAHKAARVITISKSAREDILRLLGIPSSKISVIPLAVDAAFRPKEEAEIARVREQLNLPDRYVLYVGSNKPHKNIGRLIRAWASVVTDVALVIAGHWDERYPEAGRLTENLGLKERVLFRHNVSNDDLPALLSGALAFVFPSVCEGFGLPPLEAMAAGTPVVCARASSLPEVVGEAALLFDPLDVDAMASALTRVLQDGALRDTLRAKGQAQAHCFSWERTARETLEVYRSAIKM